MISISRSLIRQFRAVARRAGLCKLGSNTTAGVRIIASSESLRLQASNGHSAVEHQMIGRFEAADLTVPWQLFADCEAKTDGVVTIRLNDGTAIVACWEDRGVPQQHNYDSPVVPEIPIVPTEMTTNPPRLLTALRDAATTADSASTRYALSCVQLRGSNGLISATDSRQLLVQSGFTFPWQEELLVQATDVFASRELPHGQSVAIGRSADFVTVQVGEWTIHQEIDKTGRFPNLERAIPSPSAIKTRMQVDAADARFLTTAVSRLPADDQTDRPLTVELNGAIVLRARQDDQSPLMELLLSRSKRIGEQLRLQMNRKYLARAVDMGFTEIGFVDAESPCVCQDATRTYVWMLLENKGALEPSAEALRIDSSSVQPSVTVKSPRGELAKVSSPRISSSVSGPVNRVAGHLSQSFVATINAEVTAGPSSSAKPSADVIELALTLRNQLRTVTQGLTDLVGQIRQQRKHNRLMKSTLQSLKQLQLLEA